MTGAPRPLPLPTLPKSFSGGRRAIWLALSYMLVGAGMYPSRFRRTRSAMMPATTRRKISARDMAKPISTMKPRARWPPIG